MYRTETLERCETKFENGDIMLDYVVIFPSRRERLRFLKSYQQGAILTVDEEVVDDCYVYWIANTSKLKIHGMLFKDPPF